MIVKDLISKVSSEIEDKILIGKLPRVTKDFVTGLIERIVVVELNTSGSQPEIQISDEEPVN